MLYCYVQSEMMRGSESAKEGIFKPQCFFSFRRCVCVPRVCVFMCVCACVIRVPSLSSSDGLQEHQSPLNAPL